MILSWTNSRLKLQENWRIDYEKCFEPICAVKYLSYCIQKFYVGGQILKLSHRGMHGRCLVGLLYGCM